MTEEEIFEALCSYDPRSPGFDAATSGGELLREPRNKCPCDNCFYGRDKLALEILRLSEK